MLSVDYRIGSGELARYFHPFGINPTRTKLEFGDFAFEGNGPNGKVTVGIERKRIEDLLDSMTSKRLSGHQLLGMSDLYDYGYLIVEGIWKPGQHGELLIGKPGGWNTKQTPYRAIDNYLATLELRAGMMIRRTAQPEETVFVVVDLYRYWTEKLWKEHRSHEEIYAPGSEQNSIHGRRLKLMGRNLTVAQKTAENIACQLPGIDRRARTVASFFKYRSTHIVNAGVDEWIAAGIGKGTAEKIVKAVRNE